MGQLLYDAEQKVLDLDAQLKIAKRSRDYIAGTQIPEFMKDAEIEFIGMSGGRRVDIKEILAVQPLAANRPLVYAAVAEAGDGSLIKTTVSIPFGRGEQEKVKKLLATLQRAGLTPKCDTKIEPSTLKKWVKDRLAAGKPVDKDLFGVRDFSKATFTEGAPNESVFDGEQ